LTQEKLKKYIDDYNSGKIKVLLITSAGSESLDLKNTRQIHILEPHWNDSKIRQVIGRANRYQSHITLKKSEQNIKIFRWITIFPLNIKYQTADQYLEELSIKKDEIFLEFKNIIIKTSIENNNNN
jgi:ERCC4-related helicase